MAINFDNINPKSRDLLKPKTTGRPRKVSTDLKTERLALYFTKEQKELIEQQAHLNFCSPAELFIKLVNENKKTIK